MKKNLLKKKNNNDKMLFRKLLELQTSKKSYQMMNLDKK